MVVAVNCVGWKKWKQIWYWKRKSVVEFHHIAVVFVHYSLDVANVVVDVDLDNYLNLVYQ